MSSFIRVLLLVTSMVIVGVQQSDGRPEPQDDNTDDSTYSSQKEIKQLEKTLNYLQKLADDIGDAIDELKNSADKQTNDASKAELEKQVKALTDRHQQLINEMDMIRAKLYALKDAANGKTGDDDKTGDADNGARRLVLQDYLQFAM